MELLGLFFILPAMELFRSSYRGHRRFDSYECRSVRILESPNGLLSLGFWQILKEEKWKKQALLAPIFGALKDTQCR